MYLFYRHEYTDTWTRVCVHAQLSVHQGLALCRLIINNHNDISL